jgi:DNA-binding response OmpR family regulator
MRLLVVEDDDIVADAIARGLSAAKYSVHRVSSAEAAQSAMATEEFALAVIDVGLPGADGLTLVRRLRSSGKTMPTLILTARCTLNDKVKALDLGADDFLSKPFEPAELAARCRALMRRSSGALDGIIKLNRMSVDLVGRRLSIDGAEVELTAREWLLLECLVRRIGQVVSKERVHQAVTNREQDITPNAIEVHVSRLRAKLGEAAVIRSLRGLGYRLEEAKAS